MTSTRIVSRSYAQTSSTRITKHFFFKLIKQQIEPKKLALISIQDMASDAQQMMRSERFAAELASIEQDALHSQKNSNIHIKKTHKGEEEIQIEM